MSGSEWRYSHNQLVAVADMWDRQDWEGLTRLMLATESDVANALTELVSVIQQAVAECREGLSMGGTPIAHV